MSCHFMSTLPREKQQQGQKSSGAKPFVALQTTLHHSRFNDTEDFGVDAGETSRGVSKFGSNDPKSLPQEQYGASV